MSVVRLVLSIAALLLMTSPAKAEWLRAETDHFVIYGDVSERTMRRYAQKVERFDALLRRYYPIAADHQIPKLEIFLADGLSDMRQVWPGIDNTVGGFYSPNSGRITAVVNQASGRADLTLFHEYAHHFMFQMASAAYPAWFVEGFAEFYATARVEDRLEVGRFDEGRMQWLTYATHPWGPIEDVLSWKVMESGRYRGGDYYAQAWLLTHYMLSDPERTRALGQYLTAVTQGADPAIAMQQATGRTPQQLQQALRGHISGSIPTWSPQIDLPVPEVRIDRLTPVEAEMVWIDVRLDRLKTDRSLEEEDEGEEAEPDEDQRRETAEAKAERDAERAAFLRRAVTLAERHGDDPMALMVKARAQRLTNEPQAALDTLAPILASSEADGRALYIAGMASLDLSKSGSDEAVQAEHRRTARQNLARAIDAEPLDFRIYLALDESRQGFSDYPSANDLSTLLVAATLAPQSFEARTRTAAALMSHDRPAEAVVMLTPVANSPHGGSRNRSVQAALGQARAAAGLPPIATSAPPATPVAETDATPRR